MAQYITIDSIIAWLQGRGYWLSAGSGSFPGFLAASLGYRDADNKERARKILLSDPDGLIVEFDPRQKTRITRIGLPEWLNDKSIPTIEIPEGEALLATYAQALNDNGEQQREIASLRAQLAARDMQLTQALGDLVAAEALLDGAANHTLVASAETELERLTAEAVRLKETITRLEAERDGACKRANNARNARDNAISNAREERSQSNKRIAQLESLLEAALGDAERWRELVGIAKRLRTAKPGPYVIDTGDRQVHEVLATLLATASLPF